MGINFKMPVTFEICFPKEKQKPIDHYLRNLCKEQRLLMGCFLLGFKNKASKFSGLKNFLFKYFSQDNYGFANIISKRIITFANENNFKIEQFEIPYAISSLTYFEYVYDNPAKFEKKEYSKEEFLDIEINFFKAYTIFNQLTITKRGEKLAQNFKTNNIENNLINFNLSNNLHSFDIIDYQINKIFYCQFLKAYSFLNF